VWGEFSGVLLGEVAQGDPQNSIDGLAFSPDETKIAFGTGYEGRGDSALRGLEIWEFASGSPPVSLVDAAQFPEGGIPYSLAFNPDGALLADASSDSSQRDIIRLWAIGGSPETYRELMALAVSAYSVTFSPDGTLLVSAGKDGTIRFWGVRSEGSGS
jgi:WD40 repeat protein